MALQAQVRKKNKAIWQKVVNKGEGGRGSVPDIRHDCGVRRHPITYPNIIVKGGSLLKWEMKTPNLRSSLPPSSDVG